MRHRRCTGCTSPIPSQAGPHNDRVGPSYKSRPNTAPPATPNKKRPRFSRTGGVFHCTINSAIASQQRRLFTARTPWQLIQLLRRRETITLRLLMNDLRPRPTRILHRWLFPRLIITRRTTVTRLFATGLPITGSAITRTATLGRRSPGSRTVTATRTILTTLRLPGTRSACTRSAALSRSPWTTTTTLGRLGLRHVVNAIPKVIYIVIQELVRSPISRRAWRLAWLTLLTSWSPFTGLLLTGRTLAATVRVRRSFFLAALVL